MAVGSEPSKHGTGSEIAAEEPKDKNVEQNVFEDKDDEPPSPTS